MKNKKIGLLASLLFASCSLFGPIYQISQNGVNSNYIEPIISNDSKKQKFSMQQSIPFKDCVNDNGTVSGQIFVEINEENQTLRIIQDDITTKGTNIKFNDSVSFKGKKYTITSIAPKAFLDNTNLKGNITFNSELRSIGDEAFSGCSNLTGTLPIPKNVTYVGDYAFNNCSGLNSSLILPKNLKYLGAGAFCNCSGITGTLVIPEQITQLGDYTFKQCSKFTNITFSNNLKTIGKNCFESCVGLKEVIMPDSIQTIGERCFTSCTNIKNLKLSNNLQSIPDYALFSLDSLRSLTIPASVKTIGSNAIAVNSSTVGITDLTFAPNSELEEIGGWAFHYIAVSSLSLPNKLKRIGERAFCHAPNLTGPIKIPESVVSIGANIFMYDNVPTTNSFVYSVSEPGYKKWCLGFGTTWPSTYTNVSLPADTYGISDNCFGQYGFNFTGNVGLNDDIEYIGEEAFATISATSITGTPKKLKSIGKKAFYNCSLLTSSNLFIPNTIEKIGESAFEGCINLTKLSIDQDINRTTKCEIDKRAFYGCNRLAGWLRIPTYVSKIGLQAFYGCTSFSKEAGTDFLYSTDGEQGYNHWLIGDVSGTSTQYQIIVHASTYGIAGGAFLNSSNVRELWIANTKIIGEYAFSGCTNLKDVDLSSESLTTIDDYAFNGCTSIAKLPLENDKVQKSLTTIGVAAFKDCSSMAGKLTISKNIEHIGNYAFQGCSSLTDTITINGSDNFDMSSYNMFANCSNVKKVEILNNNIKTIGTYTFLNCTSLSSITLPDSIETIKSNAFELCSSLEKIVIPQNTKIIEDSAFKNCSKLSELTLNDKLEKIGSNVFESCYNLTGTIVFPKTIKEIGKESFANDFNIERMIFQNIEPPKMGYSWLSFENPNMETIIQIPYGGLQDYFDGNVSVKTENIEYYPIQTFKFKLKPGQSSTIFAVKDADKKFDLFQVEINEYSSQAVQFTIESANDQPLPSWISIDEKTGVISLASSTEVGEFKLKVTVTSLQDKSISRSMVITLNVNNVDVESIWWIWVIVAISIVGVGGFIYWIYYLASKKNKKHK